MCKSEQPTLEIIGFAGSLRRDSWNRRLLHAAALCAPEGLKLTVFEDLDAIPLFNEDLEIDDPRPVRAFRQRITQADGVLIATPEYNGSMPGVLKNALDWLSRPYRQGCLIAKPVAVTGATPGSSGARDAQQDLRNILWNLKALVFPAPTVLINHVESRFDEAGGLTDAATRQALAAFLAELAGFVRWAQESRKPAVSPHEPSTALLR